MIEPSRPEASWKPPPEFLRELPDMLCGKEPELLRPEARAWMMRDPMARAYAEQIRGAVAMFADLPVRMSKRSTESLDVRARRGVERAARQLPARLAEVLWPIFLQDLDREIAAIGGTVYQPHRPRALDVLDRTEEVRRGQRILELMRLHRLELPFEKLERSILSPAFDVNSRPVSTHGTLAVIRHLLPTSIAVRLMSLHHRRIGGRPPSKDEWTSMIDLSATDGLRDLVLAGAQVAYAKSSLHAESNSIARTFFAEYPNSPVGTNAAYVGALSAISVGDRRVFAEYCDLFHRLLTVFASQRATWTWQFLTDGSQWRSALDVEPRGVERVMSALGGPG